MGNALRILPPDIGKLTKLRVLAADSNQLTILPGGVPMHISPSAHATVQQ